MLTIKTRWFFLLCLLFLTACVTINVYFPVQAAEKAADKIIDKVWGNKPQPTDDKEPTIDDSETPQTNESRVPTLKPLVYWPTHWIGIIISPAYAGANLDISSSAIKALQARMRKRHRKLKPFYNNGAVGLTNNALITLRSPAKIPLKKRRDVKRWVTQENKDRLNLYRKIAQANGHPEWEASIRKTFARRWIKRASRGWWYQDGNGKWRQR